MDSVAAAFASEREHGTGLRQLCRGILPTFARFAVRSDLRHIAATASRRYEVISCQWLDRAARGVIEESRIACQDMTPAGAKKVQRSPDGRPIEIRFRFFEIRRNALSLQSQEDCLENVLRIVGVSCDDTGSTVNQLIVLTKDFLNPWDSWWRHLENRSGRHPLLDVNIQQEGDLLTPVSGLTHGPTISGRDCG
jgi:hypothetical protein